MTNPDWVNATHIPTPTPATQNAPANPNPENPTSYQGDSRNNQGAPQYPANTGTGWSVANAIAWSGLLTEGQTANDNPGEKDALRNFLSLYSLTVNNQTPGVNDGGWEDIEVQNGAVVKEAIFGNGEQGNVIQNVFLGTVLQNGVYYNTYPRMRNILTRLGVQVSTSAGNHYHHFHIDFRPPVLKTIDGPQSLVASENIEEDISDISLVDLIEHAKATLSQYLGLDIGEFDMYALEPPVVPDSSVVIVAAAEVAEKSKERAIDYCYPTQYIAPGETSKVFPDIGGMDPIFVAISSLSHDATATDIDFNKQIPFSAVQLINGPEHGTLSLYKPIKDGSDYWRYLSDEGYTGNDQVEFLVDVHGMPVHVFYFIKVGPPGFGVDSEEVRGLCNGKFRWIISQPSAEDYNAPVSWYRATSLQTLLSGANASFVGFADFTGSALGQTTGSQITLDTRAFFH